MMTGTESELACDELTLEKTASICSSWSVVTAVLRPADMVTRQLLARGGKHCQQLRTAFRYACEFASQKLKPMAGVR